MLVLLSWVVDLKGLGISAPMALNKKLVRGCDLVELEGPMVPVDGENGSDDDARAIKRKQQSSFNGLVDPKVDARNRFLEEFLVENVGDLFVS